MNKKNVILILSSIAATLATSNGYPQDNSTPNGIVDNRQDAYALTHGNISQPDGQILEDATLLIRDGKVVEISSNNAVPGGFFEIDLYRRYVYPGLVDIYTQYGIPELKREADENGTAENLFSNRQALNVNSAIRSHFRASTVFTPDDESRDKLRALGFSSVLSFRADGIARGTSALITLGDENANESIIAPDVAAHYSLSKGTSTQSMPSSMMGAIALIRQTHLDAQWYASQTPRPFTDESLEAWTRTQALPQIMEVADWQRALTVDRIGDEFSTQYILKVGGDSYKQSELLKQTGATLIVPLNFPDKPDVDDAIESNDVSLADLKHWELAPYNLSLLARAEVPFVITSEGAEKSFWKNLRAAVKNGLPVNKAIQAITRTPAELLGVESQVGQLIPGALANFVISSGPLLDDDSRLLENWIHGQRYELRTDLDDQVGSYQLAVGDDSYSFELTSRDGDLHAKLVTDVKSTKKGTKVDIELSNELIALSFVSDEDGNKTRLNGWPTEQGWRGNGRLPDGSRTNWTLSRVAPSTFEDGEDQSAAADVEEDEPGSIIYPFVAYGRESLPQQRDVVIRGATVWTNEEAGVVVTDVLVRNGKIAEIGDSLTAGGAVEVDGSGKHLTPGIIDEHSHIALFSINEIETNSSMVRMQDVVNSENIGIYRNLAGGVTAAQLLHGSANPIGGQSALIKMRWGLPPQELLIEDADKFIKFALGENVKRSSRPSSIR